MEQVQRGRSLEPEVLSAFRECRVIPATPGYKMAVPKFGADGEITDLEEFEIVAWAIGAYGTFPVTAFGPASDQHGWTFCDHYAVKLLDGRYEFQFKDAAYSTAERSEVIEALCWTFNT